MNTKNKEMQKKIKIYLDKNTKRSVSLLSYHKPAYNRNTVVYEDGGTTANNPTFLEINLAKVELSKKLQIEKYDRLIVSIGTGSITSFDEYARDDYSENILIGVSKKLLLSDAFRISKNVVKTHEKVKHLFGKIRLQEDQVTTDFSSQLLNIN